MFISINNRYNKDAEDAISLRFEGRRSSIENRQTILNAKQNLVSSEPLLGGAIAAASYDSQLRQAEKDKLELTIQENKEKKLFYFIFSR